MKAETKKTIIGTLTIVLTVIGSMAIYDRFVKGLVIPTVVAPTTVVEE